MSVDTEDPVQLARATLESLDRFMAGQRQNWLDPKHLGLQDDVVRAGGKLGAVLFFIPTMRTHDATYIPSSAGYAEWYAKRFPWTTDPEWREKYSQGATYDFPTGSWLPS